jgi:hypothetical protein
VSDALDELRQAAEAAASSWRQISDDPNDQWYADADSGELDDLEWADRDFIIAASPSAILALITELEQAAARETAMEDLLRSLDGRWPADALRAILETP